MKTFISLILFFTCFSVMARETPKKELQTIYIGDDISVHFVSPEPIQFVDISTKSIVGDIPVDNVLRIKYISDTTKDNSGNETVVTIIGQSFISQFNVVYTPDSTGKQDILTRIEILPEHMDPLEYPDISMTFREMKEIAYKIVCGKKPVFNNVMSQALKMKARLNNIYSVGDYIFIDVSFKNKTHLKYDIDQFRFRIKDKRITKATNVQDLEIKPVFSLYGNKYFRRDYRNVFVFKKFTFPGNKVFCISLDEKQISGRSIELNIDYCDLLHADTL